MRPHSGVQFSVTRTLLFLGALMALLFGMLSLPGGALAKSAAYQQFDVDLTVLDDGTFRIEETQTVRFTDGPFVQGHRSIPLTRIEGVENIAVYEIVDGDLVEYTETDTPNANTFRVQRTSTEVDIRWTFMTVYDDTRTFVVAYDLVGALRSYPDAEIPNQQVWYTPVGSALTDETRVENATYTVHLPQPADPESVVLAEDGDQITDLAGITDDYQTFTFEHGSFDGGDSWEIRLQTGIVAPNAPIPSWQAADDANRASQEEQENRDTRVAGLAGIAAIALLIFGGLGIFLLWYTRGRDPHTGAVASFLPEPPDDTPPAIVGVLIDERAQEHDIVSTFTDWGRRGIMAIHDPQGAVSTFELLNVPNDLTQFEQRLMHAVFPNAERGERVVPMTNARGAVSAFRKELEADLYEEVERKGWFRRSPESTRNRWRNAATVITSLSIIGGILGSMLYSPWLLLPAFAITALSIVLRLTARVLPQRTREGAEAVAKWRAFERYLKDLEKYDNLDTARANFERFLPYTIIFGLEKQWVQRFQASGAARPSWLDAGDLGDMVGRVPGGRVWGDRPVIIHTGGGSGFPSGGDGGGGGIDLPDINMPDLQKTSDSAARGIGGASRGAVDVLNVIGAIFEIVSIFGGGGGSGGSSGGGGGGFD